jgi:hypothetical protein
VCLGRFTLVLSILVSAQAWAGSARLPLRTLLDHIDSFRAPQHFDPTRPHPRRRLLVDEKNGFARIVGEFEGHLDYFLFRGKGTDLVVEASFACGPACTEDIEVFWCKEGKDDDGEPGCTDFAPVPFLEAIDLKALGTSVTDLKEHCLNEDGTRFEASSPDRHCPYIFSFPKRGTRGQVFRFEDDEEPAVIEGVKLKAAAAIVWKDSRLTTEKAPSRSPVTLDEAAIEDLF